MPKRLVCVAKGQLEWQDYEEPPLRPTQVRISAQFGAAKHGTEMATFKGYSAHRGRYDPQYHLFRPSPEPRSPHIAPVGNMVVGTVEEAGKEVGSLSVGDRVCAYSGFSETCVADVTACWKMPPGVSWKSAVCLDPSDFALGAIRDGHVRVGDAVAVFGLGAIGLMVVQLAQLAGAYPVIGIDPLPNRRAVADQLGATLTLDPTACDAGLEIKKATDKRGADVIIDYSGAMAAVQQALRGVAYGGTVVLGSYPAPYGAGLDLGGEAHLNIPKVVFTRACSQPDREHPRWDNDRIYSVCWRLLCEGALTGKPIVQPVVAFDALIDGYPRIATDPGSNVKLGVRY